MLLDVKDLLIISISSLALILSAITFTFNFIQKRRDNLRALRKELTEVIKEMVETTISITKIEMEAKLLSNQVYDLRRSYNQRRRYLIDRAEFLISDIPSYVTHVDLSSIAQACQVSGLYSKAEIYFLKLLEIVPLSVELIFSTRGYARFLYLNSNVELGREYFEDILYKLENNTLDISEHVKIREQIDTTLWYSRAEYNINNLVKADQLYLNAVALGENVKERSLKKDMDTLLKENLYLKEKVVENIDGEKQNSS